MEKTFTLKDYQTYLHEISFFENGKVDITAKDDGPSQMTIRNILQYSSALNILRTKAAGTVFQIGN